MSFEEARFDKNQLLDKLHRQFSDIECTLKNETTLKVISNNKIDIAPVVHFLSTQGFYILEAKLIQPTLEDAFIKMTGIEIDIMKKEKEKK